MPETPTLVLLPGFMCDHGLWDDMLGALGELGPLHFADLSLDPDIPGMAARLLAETSGPLILIGFSMGGYVARHLAVSHPARVRAMILIGSSARGDTPERRERNRIAAAAQADRPYRGMSRSALARALHRDREDDQAMIDRIQAMAVRMGREAFLRQLAIHRGDERRTLGAIACPVLVVASRDDRLRSLKEAEELRDGIAGAELRLIAGCGHMAPMENPAGLAALIRSWLSSRTD